MTIAYTAEIEILFWGLVSWVQDNWFYKLFFFLLTLMSLKTFMKTYGWLRKKNLKGKHVYITGAGMGIGKKMALVLAKQGANLTLVDIQEKALR